MGSNGHHNDRTDTGNSTIFHSVLHGAGEGTGAAMSSPAARERWLRHRLVILETFCKKFDLSITALNKGYQWRVENLVDFYPVNGRYCILSTGECGDWETSQHLRRIMLKALPELDTHNAHNDMVDATAYAYANHPRPVDDGTYYGHKHMIWLYKLVDKIIGWLK